MDFEFECESQKGNVFRIVVAVTVAGAVAVAVRSLPLSVLLLFDGNVTGLKDIRFEAFKSVVI